MISFILHGELVVQLDGHFQDLWWLMDLTPDVTGRNPTFDPDSLSTAICQSSHRGIRKLVRVISYSADSTVTWLEEQVMYQVKVIVVTYFARKSHYLFLYSHGTGKLNQLLLSCSFPGDLPKMKLHSQRSCIICVVVEAKGSLTSCKPPGEMTAFRHGQRITSDCF